MPYNNSSPAPFDFCPLSRYDLVIRKEVNVMFEPRKIVGHRHPFYRPGWQRVFWRYSNEQQKLFTVDIALPSGIYWFDNSEEAKQWEQDHQMIFHTMPRSKI